MLKRLGTPRWQRLGAWLRGVGVVLLLVGFFAPLGGLAAAALLIPGLVFFSLGAILWLSRDAEPWLRR